MDEKDIVTEAGKVIKILNKYLKVHNWHGKDCKSELDLDLKCENCRKLVDEMVLELVH